MTANPMFTPLDQPRIGEYLAPGLPMSINGDYPQAVAAPALGDDTAAVLAEWLGLGTGIDGCERTATGSGDRVDEPTARRCWTSQRGADDDTWIGPASGPEGKRSFGGQFVAQSLAAACRTVEGDRPAHQHASAVPARR